MEENINYKPKSHFFVDYNALDTASSVIAADAFGPVANNLTTQYRTTSFVRALPGTPAVKVFAICDGRVLIQPMADDVNKVNLILKPDTTYAPIKIKYFIYRGVNKADLILNNTTLTPVSESNTTQPEFLKELWKIFERYNTSISGTPVPTVFPPYKIGYDPSNPSTNLIDVIFNQRESDTYQLPPCSAGMHLGYFTGRIGLDIVLDDGDYQLDHQEEQFKFDLEYAQKSQHIFNVSTISGSQARYREYVLRFLDAAAFWGSHSNCGTIQLTNGAIIKTPQAIYTNILNKYQTKHNVYIHIMEERGRSFSYYDEDDDASHPNNKRKVYFGLSTTLSVDYNKTHGWPILIKEFDSVEVDTTIYGGLEYKIDEFINQIEQFIAIEIFTPSDLNAQKFLKKITNTDSTESGVYCFSTCVFAQANKVCTSFIFINCNFKQTFPLVHYFNELWPANIKSTFSLPDEDSISLWCTYDRSRIVNLDEILSTGAVIQNKVFFDTGKNTNLTSTTKKRRLYIATLKENTTTNAEYNNLNAEDFNSCFFNNLTYFEYIQCLYDYDHNFSVYKGTFTDSTENKNINTLSLFHNNNILKGKSYYQLGISENEYDTIITNNSNLPVNADNIFFYLKEVLPFYNPPGSTGGTGPLGSDTVRKFKLGLSYENNTGTVGTCFPPADIDIYTIDGCYFFSKDYSDYQSFYTEFAKAKVEFRTIPVIIPANGTIPLIPAYNGEFGFDWLRIGDNLNTTNDPKYSDIIVSGYERPKVDDLNTEYENKYEAFKALKQEYFSLPAQGNGDYYVIPYLSLFSKEIHDKMINTHNLPYEANLRVLVEIEENLNKLEFDYDISLFDITINNSSNTQKNILSDKNICIKGESIDKTVKITCLRDFAVSQLIKVWAYPVGVTNKRDAKLAGAIFVNKNDALTRKHLKFVYVKVKTNVNGSGNVVGAEEPDEKINLQNALYHSLVIATIENSLQDLDLSSNPDYQIGGQFIHPTSHDLYEDATNFFQNLRYLFLNDKDSNNNLINSKYNTGYFFVFVFGALAYDNAAGQVEDIGVRNLILFPFRNERTLVHEGMHGLFLRHTHRDGSASINDPNQLFIYPKFNDNPLNGPIYIVEATDNYMSYAHSLRKTTWHWQWNIIKNNLK